MPNGGVASFAPHKKRRHAIPPRDAYRFIRNPEFFRRTILGPAHSSAACTEMHKLDVLTRPIPRYSAFNDRGPCQIAEVRSVKVLIDRDRSYRKIGGGKMNQDCYNGNQQLEQRLRGGVIMDVTTPDRSYCGGTVTGSDWNRLY